MHLGVAHSSRRRRAQWAVALPLPLLAATLLLAPWAVARSCPAHCVCNITMQLFYHVSCSRSSMDSIPAELPSKAFTTLLSMEFNRLQRLRENSLDNFKQLQVLNLDNNQLNFIDTKAFHQCPQLRLLRLANNSLKTLNPELFKENKLLQFIDLSFNELILPKTGPFLRSPSLFILNLTSSYLSEIPVSTFAEMSSLSQLELRNNFLRTVDVRAVQVFRQKNATLLLTGNPLRCDCQLKPTWKWQMEHLPARQVATCAEPEHVRDAPWDRALRDLDCGEAATRADAGTYALYGIVALLAVIAALVGTLVWVVRRRRQRATASGTGGRKRRLAPPEGEYIDVLPDAAPAPAPAPAPEPVYDALAEPKKTFDQSAAGKDNTDTQRYVMDVFRNTYLPPVKPSDDGPIYVNMRGPPLPLRRPSDVPPPPSEPAPLAPDAVPAPAPVQRRPCSIPLLEGCDFYEVVD